MPDHSPVNKPELIACIDGGEAETEHFLRTAQPAITDATYKVARRLSVTAARDIEEIRSIVSEFAWKLAIEVKVKPENAKTGHTLESMLVARSQQAATRHVARLTSAASGTVGISRKGHLLDQMRAELSQKLGRNPTDAELVTAHNERMFAQRKNPKKQGVIATVDDIGIHRRMVSTPIHVSTADSPDETTSSIRLDRAGFASDIHGSHITRGEPTSVFSPIEGEKFHKNLVAVAESTDQRLGEIAQRWIELITQGNEEHDASIVTESPEGPQVVSGSIIGILCDEFTLEEHETRNAVGLIRDLGREVLEETMGITAADI